MNQRTIAAARASHAALLDQSLEYIVRTLSALAEVERVSVYGSYARGRRDLFTDLDVLVVMNTPQPFVERLRRLYSLLAVPVDLDLVCYTPQEFLAMRRRPFFAPILRGEVILYEKGCA